MQNTKACYGTQCTAVGSIKQNVLVVTQRFPSQKKPLPSYFFHLSFTYQSSPTQKKIALINNTKALHLHAQHVYSNIIKV